MNKKLIDIFLEKNEKQISGHRSNNIFKDYMLFCEDELVECESATQFKKYLGEKWFGVEVDGRYVFFKSEEKYDIYKKENNGNR